MNRFVSNGSVLGCEMANRCHPSGTRSSLAIGRPSNVGEASYTGLLWREMLKIRRVRSLSCWCVRHAYSQSTSKSHHRSGRRPRDQWREGDDCAAGVGSLMKPAERVVPAPRFGVDAEEVSPP